MNRFFQILLFLCLGTAATAQTDTIPPAVFCPANDTVTLPANDCFYQYFYVVTSSDNEPGDTLVQVSGLESGADFPLSNTVNVFLATDAAGNTASCSFQVTVQNFPAPLSCISSVSISLDANCMAQANAATLLSGLQNACPDSYVVEVDKSQPFGNGPWSPAVFGPADVGETYLFRVSDPVTGNNCTGSLSLNDGLPPALVCDSLTISCAVADLSPYFLRDSLGLAAAVPLTEDACSPVTLTHLDSTVPDSCASGFVGHIYRTWTAKDASNNTSTCVQVVSLARPSLSDLRYPPDVALDCADADISTGNTGQPYLEFAGRKFTNTCSLGSAFSDSTVQVNACASQVIRTWFVIDWCTSEALDTVQIIDIQDGSGPVFTWPTLTGCPADLTVNTNTGSCLDSVNLPDAILVDACSGIASMEAIWEINDVADTLSAVLIYNPGGDTAPYTLAALGIVPNFPVGITPMSFVATDSCGNSARCDFNLQVLENVPPEVVCVASPLSVSIPPSGVISVFASDLLQSYADNCTPAGQLELGTRRAGDGTGFPEDGDGNPQSHVNFTCADLGHQLAELWVRDLSNNSDSCTVWITVNFGDCPIDALSVLGNVKTETINGIVDAAVSLDATTAVMQNINLQDQTDQQGTFFFQTALPFTSNYVLTPAKDGDDLNGVSTFDLLQITKHILGLEPLNSPYKIIAADANRSNSVTTFDIVEIRKLILGIYDQFPNNTSWRFVDKDFVFQNPNGPFQSPFPETISRTNVQQSYFDEDFVGIKIGDVNNSAIFDSLFVPDDRSAGALFFHVDDRAVERGEVFDVHFKASEKTLGWQFTLNVSGLEIVEVSPGEGMGSDNFGIFKDALTASVERGADAFAVTFRAIKPGQLSEMLGVSSRITRAEAYRHYRHYGNYNNDDNDLNDDNDAMTTITLDVALLFDNSLLSKVGFELYQNQPNPFRGNTSIGFHLPDNAEATLTVFDETGRVLFEKSGQYAQGCHSVLIEQGLLGGAGVLYYKLETPTDSAVRKMVVVR